MTMRILIMTFAAFALLGCGRKHIYSTPPGQQAPKPIEVSVDADAASKGATAEEIDVEKAKPAAPEGATPEFTETALKEEAVKTPETKDNKNTPTADKPVAIGEGLLFIQVGAFEDGEKARRILAQLMTEGYSGSRILKDGNLLKVQAGGFTDEAAARDAQSRFSEQYPGSFLTR